HGLTARSLPTPAPPLSDRATPPQPPPPPPRRSSCPKTPGVETRAPEAAATKSFRRFSRSIAPTYQKPARPTLPPLTREIGGPVRYALSRLRPRARRALSTLRPPGVAIRVRKP